MSRQSRPARAVLAAGLLVLAIGGVAVAQSGMTVRVPATSNPWAAGQTTPAVGTLPVGIDVPDRQTTVSFPFVGGSWSNTGPMLPADGERPEVGTAYECGGPPPCTVLAANGLSGLTDTVRFWYLTGVFLGPGLPGGSPPPAIDFTLRHEFTVLEPALDQVFFIGDGRTSDGVVQLFRIPAGSTRLFLGMADICAPGEAAGCYYDNAGLLDVTMSWGGTPDTATLPGPASPAQSRSTVLLAVAGGIAFLAALYVGARRGRAAGQ